MNNETFKNNNYVVVKGAVSKEITSFLYMYFQNKRKVANHLRKTTFLSPFDHTWGTWEDRQIPGTYSHYADMAMETLMMCVQPLMQEVTGLQLVPCYTYTRLYKYGDVLHRHKDRPSCEISTTLNLGGDNWPIKLDPSGEEDKEGITVELQAGDMLVYKGTLLEHWRDPFLGYDCAQVFMHFNDLNGPFGESNKFDTRPMLGLPAWYKTKT